MDDMLGSDDEDKHDAYLERMKREGQEAASDDDDEDSSEGNTTSQASVFSSFCISDEPNDLNKL